MMPATMEVNRIEAGPPIADQYPVRISLEFAQGLLILLNAHCDMLAMMGEDAALIRMAAKVQELEARILAAEQV